MDEAAFYADVETSRRLIVAPCGMQFSAMFPPLPLDEERLSEALRRWGRRCPLQPHDLGRARGFSGFSGSLCGIFSAPPNMFFIVFIGSGRLHLELRLIWNDFSITYREIARGARSNKGL